MFRITSIAATILVTTGVAAQAADKAALAEEGKALMMAFGGTLKGELQAAMKAGGPVNAIQVCNVRAPEIAGKVSADSGWTVARSSHRIRNPENLADEYTNAVIDDFLARQEAGEMAADLVSAEIVTEDGVEKFRLIKAIPTEEVCMNCHGGDNVKQAVVDKLAELYPSDDARGFEVGQMRGVFTLTKMLGE